ncbi:hypothetical protein EUGRSUZ_F02628 [Eucalyptus grandis]|uniref:Uncharacterized protein n=2 Tax=Eucalyptus grandis TaxID=71139 RepID=A0ACC3KIM5_EUCGR|nr:hypothetical protein EUGRSUZ_F02628 [Eucalyptus grandis]
MQEQYLCHGFNFKRDIIAKEDELSIGVGFPIEECRFKDVVFCGGRNDIHYTPPRCSSRKSLAHIAKYTTRSSRRCWRN